MSKHLLFRQLFDSETSSFTYLLADSQSREGVLIDPVLEKVNRDCQLIQELEIKLLFSLETHLHADHISGASEIRIRTQAKTGVSAKAKVKCCDLQLKDGDEILFGNQKLRVLETPGHTNTCLSFLIEDLVFTGDALLIRGNGRTDFQEGSAEILYHSITQKLFKLPKETRVYPAHDYKGFTSSTIQEEMKWNSRIRGATSKEEFVKTMLELKLPYPKKIDEALPANQKCGQMFLFSQQS